ncbi:MAG: hypothetical protein CSA15_02775 [Candidatus Delongbacteria bacterium]|nr:MAG: hypothetical protein CSA15_02775 [Candidatus Delongbacteria bacterium]
MGSISGRKCLRVLENLEKIQAIELLCASQALEFVRPLKTSPILEKVQARVREDIPHFEKDEIFSTAINKAIAIVQSGDLLNIAEGVN